MCECISLPQDNKKYIDGTYVCASVVSWQRRIFSIKVETIRRGYFVAPHYDVTICTPTYYNGCYVIIVVLSYRGFTAPKWQTQVRDRNIVENYIVTGRVRRIHKSLEPMRHRKRFTYLLSIIAYYQVSQEYDYGVWWVCARHGKQLGGGVDGHLTRLADIVVTIWTFRGMNIISSARTPLAGLCNAIDPFR